MNQLKLSHASSRSPQTMVWNLGVGISVGPNFLVLKPEISPVHLAISAISGIVFISWHIAYTSIGPKYLYWAMFQTLPQIHDKKVYLFQYQKYYVARIHVE